MEISNLLTKNLRSINLANIVSSKGLAITTIFAANGVALPWATEHLSKYAPLVAAAIAIAVGVLFDSGLRKNFVLSLVGIFNARSQTSSGKFLVAAFFIFAVSRLFLSTSATFTSAYFIKDAVTEKPDATDAKQAVEASVALRNKIVTDAEERADKIIATAEASAASIKERALYSKGEKIAQLYESKDNYVMTSKKYGQYRRLVNREYERAELLILEAQQKADKIMVAAQDRAESERTDESLKHLLTYEQRKVLEADKKASIIGSAIWGIDAVLAIIFILTSIVMTGAIKEEEDYIEDFFPDTPGFTDELADLASSLATMLTGAIGAFVAAVQLRSATLLSDVAETKQQAKQDMRNSVTRYATGRNRYSRSETRGAHGRPRTSSHRSGRGVRGGDDGITEEEQNSGLEFGETIEYEVPLTYAQREKLPPKIVGDKSKAISNLRGKIRVNKQRINDLSKLLSNEDLSPQERADLEGSKNAKIRNIAEYEEQIKSLL